MSIKNECFFLILRPVFENFLSCRIFTIDIWGGGNCDRKYLYIKYAGDLIRPAFTTEIYYDLREGSDIAFKSAKLTVIKATNETITYIVIKNFD